MENRRFRLHFTEPDILTISQKNQGLNRSWLLLKPHLKTVADLIRYVTRLFRIDNSCPDGILLYVDGFVLPEFESVEVVKDKDLICVKKRREVTNGVEREFHEMEGVGERQELGVDGRLLLANEEFENEIGGHESEEEEEGLYERVVEKTPGQESKKRKAERKPKNPKMKKMRKHMEKVSKPVLEEGEVDTLVLKEHKVGECKLPIKMVDTDQHLKCSKPAKVNILKRGTEFDGSTENMHIKIQEKGKCSRDTSQQPGDSTKAPSRSARRKKAKRLWLREKLKLETELQQKKAVAKVCQDSAKKDHLELVEKDIQKSVEKGHQESVKKGHLESVEKGHPESVIKDPQESSEDSSEESSEESSDESSEEAVMKDEDMTITKDQPVSEESSEESSEEIEDEVIPVEIRPGHIRFESRSKGDTSNHHDASQTQNPVDNFHWNGITSKKKGQKWGTSKDTNRSWNDISYQETSRMTTMTSSNIVVAEKCALDFEKLEPYDGLPKKGDVLAYRLMELSSSWCPEVSSFRVGKVSSYDPESNVIRLDSVSEYPFTIEKSREWCEEEDDVPEPDPSPYDADGSLEVEFSSIVDPRIVKRAVADSSEVTATKTKVTAAENDVRLKNGSLHSEKKKASTPTPANGAGAGAGAGAATNTWDEVIQVLSAKKQELSAKVNRDDQKQNSSKSPWSYRAMRGSALGPVMARLREQNELEGT